MNEGPEFQMETPSQGTNARATDAGRPGVLSYAVFALAACWIVVVTIVIHSFSWFSEQLLLAMGIELPFFVWPLVTWAQGLMLALPIVPLAIFVRDRSLGPIYRVWSVGLAFLFVLALARFFPMTLNQPAALVEIVLGLVCLAVLILVALWQRRRLGRPVGLWPIAMAAVPLLVFPWLWFGALGSPLDTGLNLMVGLVVGVFAGMLLGFYYYPDRVQSSGGWTEFAVSSVALGALLVILGSSLGLSGAQLLLIMGLPPLGIAAAALGQMARQRGDPKAAWPAVSVLIGLTVAAPLMFVDPKELNLLMGLEDVLGWAMRAAGLCVVAGLVVSLALWLFRQPLGRRTRWSVWLPVLGLTWLGGALVYFFLGQPGFFGEHLFVILRDQADFSAASTIPLREERLRYVFDTTTQQAEKTQAGLRRTLDDLRVSYRPYYLVNGMEVDGGPLLRAYLARQPEVDRILDSPHLRPLPEPLPTGKGDLASPKQPQWNITSIGADRVWEEFGAVGKGIVVGQSDSGVQGDHPALLDGYRGRDGQNDYNWIDPWNNTSRPTDVGGHGTHTLGSILGRTNIGVAPEAEWFACVNLARNLGNPAVYLNCMQFMLAPYPQGGDPFKDGDPSRAAHVINDSWGCPPIEGCDADSLLPATNALRAAGIFVVASAGNEGPRCGSVSDPIAIYPSAFSVGAVDKNGNVADFSSRGPVTVDGSGRVKPDIAAPGVDVLSSLPQNTYGVESGTSMAGPHVAGVVALIWSAQPKLIGNIDRTEQILAATARPYTGRVAGCFEGTKPNGAYGYGLVDAYAAVREAVRTADGR